MADLLSPGRHWAGRITFVLIFAVLVYAALLPLDTLPPTWAGPDILLALTLVWVVRRPDLAPLPVVAVLWFLTDLLLQHPPGLMTALVVVLTEVLRHRNRALRGMPFVLEWLNVAAGIIAVTLAYRLVLALLMTPQAPLGLSLMQMVMTMLAYPVLVVAARFILGITRSAPGELDALGSPL